MVRSSEADHPSRPELARSRETAVITQRELEARLWDAANSLRGPVNPSEFKAYILPTL